MDRRLRLRFAPDVGAEDAAAVREALTGGLGESQRLPDYGRSVKTFYRVPLPGGRALFVKRRRHSGCLRRLGRTLRRTKAEREFDNLLALRSRGVPCPDPVAVGRRYAKLLVAESLLAEAYLPESLPLSRALAGAAGDADRDALLDGLFDFLSLLRSRGVVHGDLHWDNLLVCGGDQGREFRLIDALHVRLVTPPAADAFADSVRWFLVMLVHRHAPQTIIDAFLDRVPRLGLAALGDRRRLLDEASRLAAKL